MKQKKNVTGLFFLMEEHFKFEIDNWDTPTSPSVNTYWEENRTFWLTNDLHTFAYHLEDSTSMQSIPKQNQQLSLLTQSQTLTCVHWCPTQLTHAISNKHQHASIGIMIMKMKKRKSNIPHGNQTLILQHWWKVCLAKSTCCVSSTATGCRKQKLGYPNQLTHSITNTVTVTGLHSAVQFLGDPRSVQWRNATTTKN